VRSAWASASGWASRSACASGSAWPWASIGHRTEEVLALAEGGALDVGGGLRAQVRGGAVKFGASRGPAAPHPDRGAA